MQVQPVSLAGEWVRLEPLSQDHAPQLFEAAQHDDIWRYVSISRPQTLADMQAIIKEALQQQSAGTRLPFAIMDRASGRAIGSTSYLDIQPQHKGIEIGWTWLGRPYWRTPRNTECKYLLLKHAFEQLGAIRVQLKTSSRNQISQDAIARIGGVREGVLRNHMIYPDGSLRSSVYFSILSEEWTAVKANLEAKLAAYRPLEQVEP